jgi:hypothetical protein
MGKGKLVFKGSDHHSKKNNPSKHQLDHKPEATHPDSQERRTIPSLYEKPSGEAPSTRLPQSRIQSLQKGEGKIISSGTVLTGVGTKFLSCLNAGDAIVVDIPCSGKTQQEMRVITMRLSDTSAAISTPFQNDLKLPTSYSYIQKPRDYRSEEATQKKKEAVTKQEIERHAFGTYSGAELVFRERTEHGSYRIKKEEIPTQDLNRTELLDRRARKTSDKYC